MLATSRLREVANTRRDEHDDRSGERDGLCLVEVDAGDAGDDDEDSAEKLVPEGVEGRVPYKGSVVAVIQQLMGGLRSAMGYVGCETIADMKEHAEFVEITAAGVRESHVHDVQIVKEAPNYRAE